MRARSAEPIDAGQIASPNYAYGASSGFAPLTDEAGVAFKRNQWVAVLLLALYIACGRQRTILASSKTAYTNFLIDMVGAPGCIMVGS